MSIPDFGSMSVGRSTPTARMTKENLVGRKIAGASPAGAHPVLKPPVEAKIGWIPIIGPHIFTPAQVEKYNRWDINRMAVRPGITGLWQASGRSDATFEERVRLDMYCIRNRGI